ncbi:protein takeout [Chelonus insularis]|uniref:protein takeout n=1 Tax=Chelonus insularis TaxID=460826 RepID=UPI00158D585A|nr:protein takeout [Chelonus insularis]
MSKFVLSIIVISFVATVQSVDLPEFLHVCKRNDPDIDNCIKSSVEHLRPYLVKGVPEYNLPSLEPLLLKEIVIAEGQGGIRIAGKNINAFGASDFTVASMKADMTNLIYKLDIVLPHLYVDGEYDVDGRILLLPVTGSGRMTGNFTDCTGAVKFTGEIYKNDAGVEYLRVKDDFNLKITVHKGSLKLDNLFGGQKAIGEVINSAINSNFDAILRELKPLIEKALADVFLEVGNSIVSIFTYEQLFPL